MIWALLLGALPGGLALAQDGPGGGQAAIDARARELWENGAILYNEGRYEDAILAWDEAYHLSERPLILTNIANAQERLGLWQDALETLNRYRAYAPAGERDSLDRRIANLERRLAEQAQAPPVSTPVAATSAGPGRALPAALLAGGVAGLGASAGFGVLAVRARDEALGLCVSSGDGVLCPSAAGDALGRDRRYSLIADAALGSGAVLAAAGVAALLRVRGGSAPLQAGVGPTPGGGVVVLTGGF